jgi:hypothetical protein
MTFLLFCNLLTALKHAQPGLGGFTAASRWLSKTPGFSRKDCASQPKASVYKIFVVKKPALEF